jgi:hypothetical protein
MPTGFECTYDRRKRVLTIILDINAEQFRNDSSVYLHFNISNDSYWFEGVIKRTNTYWCGGSAAEQPSFLSFNQIYIKQHEGPA